MYSLLATRPTFGPFFARVLLGVVMFPHGAQKLLGWFGGPGLSAALQSFASMGVPAPLAFLVILAESLGAVALVLGFLTRIAAAGIFAEMLGAVAIVHGPNGFFMNWSGEPRGEGFEYHLLVLAISGALAIEGAGVFSVDGWLAQYVPRRIVVRRARP
jgi:putative oxidoreductase